MIGGISGIGRMLSLLLGRRPEPTHRVSPRRNKSMNGGLNRTARPPDFYACSDVRNRPPLKHYRRPRLNVFGKVDILINCAGKLVVCLRSHVREDDRYPGHELEWHVLRACQIFGKHIWNVNMVRIVNLPCSTARLLSPKSRPMRPASSVVSLTLSCGGVGQRGRHRNASAPCVVRTARNSDLLDPRRAGLNY